MVSGGVETTLGYGGSDGGWTAAACLPFGVQIETYDGGSFEPINLIRVATGYSLALGDALASTGTFSWNGVMVGRNSDIASSAVSNGRGTPHRSGTFPSGRYVG